MVEYVRGIYQAWVRVRGQDYAQAHEQEFLEMCASQLSRTIQEIRDCSYKERHEQQPTSKAIRVDTC